jgi:hypothetical protein
VRFGGFRPTKRVERHSAPWVVHLDLKCNGYDRELASTTVVVAAVGGPIEAKVIFVIE